MPTQLLPRFTPPVIFATAALAGCGGNVVFEAGAGGGSSSDSTTSSGVTTSTSTGTGPCTTHADCDGGVCIFATGTCAPACEPFTCDACGPGSFCEPCASSSCPACDDCIAACMPASPGRCDDDDPCPDGGVCVYSQGACYPPCGPMGECGDFSYCEGCATGSCCGCKDCVSACLGGR